MQQTTEVTPVPPGERRITEHAPTCDSRLGPEFVVKDGAVEMVLHICVGYECQRNGT